MHLRNHLMLLELLGAGNVAAQQYTVSMKKPSNAAAVDEAPIGASFEFFMWPSYMTNISLTFPCMDAFTELYGRKMPIRVGGTTQDRATYDPEFKGYVSYSVDNPLMAPMSLTYGPRFFDLIDKYGSETILGLNRGLDNRSLTFSAALEARRRAGKHLWAIELGNEPDLFYEHWKYPVATAPWNMSQEANDAADWAQDFANTWKSPLPILAAGGYAIPFDFMPGWPSLPYLVEEVYNQSVKAATKVYNGHLYALSDPDLDGLRGEMRHPRVVADLSLLPVANAKADNKPYIIGETGFHGQDVEMDSTFGAAIQVADKSLRAMTLGVYRMFYHQGTINQFFSNWWWSDRINAPFYGAYFGALAISGGDHIVAGDDGTNNYAQYTVYSGDKAIKLVFINTDYYSGNGTRSKTTFTVKGIKNGNVNGIRMSAPNSEAIIPAQQQSPAQGFNIGGQSFSNMDCKLLGKRNKENIRVVNRTLSVDLKASEALIIYL